MALVDRAVSSRAVTAFISTMLTLQSLRRNQWRGTSHLQHKPLATSVLVEVQPVFAHVPLNSLRPMIVL